jgi:hypothetical protein
LNAKVSLHPPRPELREVAGVEEVAVGGADAALRMQARAIVSTTSSQGWGAGIAE